MHITKKMYSLPVVLLNDICSVKSGSLKNSTNVDKMKKLVKKEKMKLMPLVTIKKENLKVFWEVYFETNEG